MAIGVFISEIILMSRCAAMCDRYVPGSGIMQASSLQAGGWCYRDTSTENSFFPMLEALCAHPVPSPTLAHTSQPVFPACCRHHRVLLCWT